MDEGEPGGVRGVEEMEHPDGTSPAVRVCQGSFVVAFPLFCLMFAYPLM